jgi:hypothetical protein
VSGLGGVDEVQLTPNNKTTNDPVLDPYTWSLAISPPEEAYGITPSASTRSTTCSNGSENANRPGETTAEGDDPPS